MAESFIAADCGEGSGAGELSRARQEILQLMRRQKRPLIGKEADTAAGPGKGASVPERRISSRAAARRCAAGAI